MCSLENYVGVVNIYVTLTSPSVHVAMAIPSVHVAVAMCDSRWEERYSRLVVGDACAKRRSSCIPHSISPPARRMINAIWHRWVA